MSDYTPASNLFSKYVIPTPQEEADQRGALLKEFALKTGYPIKRICYKLTGMHDIPTLLYIKSQCDDLTRTGKKSSYRHAFNSSIYKPVDK